MKIPTIGDAINLPLYSEQVIQQWMQLNCWHEYASGKAAGPKARSKQAVYKTLAKYGITGSPAGQFITDTIQLMRLKQRAAQS